MTISSFLKQSAVAGVVALAIAVPAKADWSGLYIGASIGWMGADLDWTFPTPANSTTSTSHQFDSAIAGGHIGFQHQWGQIVVGIEANLSGTTVFKPDRAESSCSFPAPFDDRCDTRSVDSLFTIGPRLGWAPNNQWLLFVTGGYATARIETAIRFGGIGVPPPPNAEPVTKTREYHEGWFIGGGVEWNLHRNWILGLEYQHVFLDDVGHCVGANCGVPSILNRNVDADLDIVRFRLSYKWGRPEEAPLK